MLKSRINEIQGYFELCSPCYQRYVDHLCRMMCGPDQANYLHITSLQPKSFTNPKVVHEVQMTLNTKWVEVIIAECSTLYEGTSSGNLTAWLTNLWDNASAFRPYKLTYKVVAKTVGIVNGLETKLLNQSLCLEQINKQVYIWRYSWLLKIANFYYFSTTIIYILMLIHPYRIRIHTERFHFMCTYMPWHSLCSYWSSS